MYYDDIIANLDKDWGNILFNIDINNKVKINDHVLSQKNITPPKIKFLDL